MIFIKLSYRIIENIVNRRKCCYELNHCKVVINDRMLIIKVKSIEKTARDTLCGILMDDIKFTVKLKNNRLIIKFNGVKNSELYDKYVKIHR